MQWSPEGAHALLQTRTATLSGELSRCFQGWYPAFPAANEELEGITDGNMEEEAQLKIEAWLEAHDENRQASEIG